MNKEVLETLARIEKKLDRLLKGGKGRGEKTSTRERPRAWTEDERKQLLDGFKRGESQEALADSLGRTPGAIAAQLVKVLRNKGHDDVESASAAFRNGDRTLLEAAYASPFARFGKKSPTRRKGGRSRSSSPARRSPRGTSSPRRKATRSASRSQSRSRSPA